MPIVKEGYYYYNLIEDAVYPNITDPTPGYITAMTKAYFKDGNADHAINFFERKLDALRKLKTKREQFLVTMYDTVYGTEDASNKLLSYDEFKTKYYKMIELGNRSMKESYAVTQLQKVIWEKDYNEIDTIF